MRCRVVAESLLAERAGLRDLLEQWLSVPSPNAGMKAAGVVAGMLASADGIDDRDVLRHGGMNQVFTGVRAASRLGAFLRGFTFGHVRQIDAVFSRVLAGLSSAVPRLLTGTDGLAFGAFTSHSPPPATPVSSRSWRSPDSASAQWSLSLVVDILAVADHLPRDGS